MSEARTEPVFIGPVNVGKSTLAKRVAAVLGVPHVDFDSVANEKYYAECGLDLRRYSEIEATDGALAAMRYAESGFPPVVEGVVADHHDCVFSLGAGHSCVMDEESQGLIEAMLEPFRNVVFLLPCDDDERSVTILRNRAQWRSNTDWILDGFDFIRHWVTSPANRRIAGAVVYTESRPPQDVTDEVLEWLRR